MPEYLAPGVYVEEVSFRSKSIEGVSTSTAGFVGPARSGPTAGEPELLTSFNQFERIFGGLDQLTYAADDDYASAQPAMHNYLAHAVRAFFDNGGRRLYVARAFRSFTEANQALVATGGVALAIPDGLDADGIARAAIPAPSASIAAANSAATNAIAAAGGALSAATGAASTARAAARASIDAALATVQAALPDGTSLPGIDSATTTTAAALAAIDGVIGGIGDPAEQAAAQAARDAAEPVIDAAVSARDAAAAAEAAVAGEEPNVAGALAAGRADGDAAALPDLDAATTTADASAATAETRAGEAGDAASDAAEARTIAAEALAALEGASPADLLARADDAAAAAGDAATAAAAAVPAAVNARTAARNAARDARIAMRAAAAAAVGGLRARYPGADGNMTVTITARVGQNVLTGSGAGASISQVTNRDLVLLPGGLFIAERSGATWSFNNGTDPATPLSALNAGTGDTVRIVSFTVEIEPPGVFAQPLVWESLTAHAERRDSLASAFAATISNRVQELETPLVLESTATPVALALGLLGDTGLDDLRNATSSGVRRVYRLSGGNDGVRPTAEEYRGIGGEDSTISSGLQSFEDIEEISIVAAPGLTFGASNGYANQALQGTQALITHCQRMRYRVAVLDSPDNQAISQVRDYRAILDTSHAAFYYPWVRILDPITQAPIHVPPSGYVVGIYARNDNSPGVHKAPANEVVLGAIGLETLLNKSQQDVLNPIGINCLRFFENRGIRVWGARTLSSDPEWKYLNIRRYFAYLERSIEKSTQWAVFEPNGEALWANVRRSVEDFLYAEWRSGRLAGTKPAEAYFVRCDRSTMTQNDLDNGRMICLIGVAPLYPAEFVIFRIGQWTADRRG